jgi:hypothetical protein
MNLLRTISRRLAGLGAIACVVTQAAFAQAIPISVNGSSCPAASVNFGSGGISIQTNGCTGLPAPTLASLNPTSVNVGSTVTAMGTNFVSGSTSVSIGATAATGVSVTNSTTLTFTVPAALAANTYNVGVSVGGQNSSTLPLVVTVPTPSISSFSPTSAKPGDTVQITGTNFVSGATVTIGGVNAPATFVSATRLDVIVPVVGAGTPAVIVTVGGTPSAASNLLTVTAPASPTISGIPASAAVNSQITITGTNFAPGMTVTIGGAAATIVTGPTATSVTVQVPNVTTGANAVVIAVTGAPMTATSAITVTSASPAPTITACSGNVNNALTITGSNIAAGASVTVNGNTVTSPVVTGSTGITGTVPAAIAAAGSYPTIVTVAGQASNSFSCTIAAAPSGLQTIDTPPLTIPALSKNAGLAGAFHPNSLNGAGSFINAYAVSPTRCSTTPALSRSWHHNINFDDYVSRNAGDFVDMGANEALTYQFTANTLGQGVVTIQETTSSVFTTTFFSITTTPCDFDTSKLANGASRNFCYQSNRANTLYFEVTNGTPQYTTYCKIVPGQTYYFNMRFQDGRNAPGVDKCAADGQAVCGGLVQFTR